MRVSVHDSQIAGTRTNARARAARIHVDRDHGRHHARADSARQGEHGIRNVSSNRRDMERTGRQIENGRFAVQLLADDIVNAGYFGEFDPRDVGPPTTRPDPCSTSAADMKNMVLMHVQGYAAGATQPSCISDVRTGTAVIAIRRTATCIAGDTNCDAAAAGQIYFQSTLCNTELANCRFRRTMLSRRCRGRGRRRSRCTSTIARQRRACALI